MPAQHDGRNSSARGKQVAVRRSDAKEEEMMPTLTPYLQQLAEMLDKQMVRAQALETLTAEQWNWSPDKNTWSVGQVVNHLQLSGNGIIPQFQKALEELKRLDKRNDEEPRLNFAERMMLRFVSPNPPFRVPVPPGFEPALTPEPKDKALPPFLNLHVDIREILVNANGYDLKAVSVESPVTRLIKPSLGAYLAITVQHQEYHGLQIDALRAMQRVEGKK